MIRLFKEFKKKNKWKILPSWFGTQTVKSYELVSPNMLRICYFWVSLFRQNLARHLVKTSRIRIRITCQQDFSNEKVGEIVKIHEVMIFRKDIETCAKKRRRLPVIGFGEAAAFLSSRGRTLQLWRSASITTSGSILSGHICSDYSKVAGFRIVYEAADIIGVFHSVWKFQIKWFWLFCIKNKNVKLKKIKNKIFVIINYLRCLLFPMTGLFERTGADGIVLSDWGRGLSKSSVE